MGLKNLLQRLLAPAVAAPDTREKNAGYQPQDHVHAGCTPDTPDTSFFHASEAAGEPRPDPDRWCWPHSSAMTNAELDRFTARLARFID